MEAALRASAIVTITPLARITPTIIRPLLRIRRLAAIKAPLTLVRVVVAIRKQRTSPSTTTRRTTMTTISRGKSVKTPNPLLTRTRIIRIQIARRSTSTASIMTTRMRTTRRATSPKLQSPRPIRAATMPMLTDVNTRTSSKACPALTRPNRASSQVRTARQAARVAAARSVSTRRATRTPLARTGVILTRASPK